MEEKTSDVIQRARRGDLDAFDELVAQHERRVWGLAHQITNNADEARDISQEVFLRVHRYLRRYDASRPFESWLYRITVNCAYDQLKKRPSFVSLDELPAEHSPALADTRSKDPAAVYEERDLQAALRRALGCLTPQERSVFVLRDVRGLTTREIAYILGCTAITVRRHSSNARLKLREALAGQFPARRPGGRGAEET